jgi:hypothetical protein
MGQESACATDTVPGNDWIHKLVHANTMDVHFSIMMYTPKDGLIRNRNDQTSRLPIKKDLSKLAYASEELFQSMDIYTIIIRRPLKKDENKSEPIITTLRDSV